MNERRILGIDPGFGRVGYAVLSAQGMDLHADWIGVPAALATDL